MYCSFDNWCMVYWRETYFVLIYSGHDDYSNWSEQLLHLDQIYLKIIILSYIFLKKPTFLCIKFGARTVSTTYWIEISIRPVLTIVTHVFTDAYYPTHPLFTIIIPPSSVAVQHQYDALHNLSLAAFACIALYCLVLPCIALHCLVLPCIALYCLVFFTGSG